MYLLNLILLILFTLILFFTLVYLLLPWFFNLFVSPKFNATYLYNPKDFKKKAKPIQLPIQNNIGQLDFDKNQGTYSISFGDKRQLINGIIVRKLIK